MKIIRTLIIMSLMCLNLNASGKKPGETRNTGHVGAYANSKGGIIYGNTTTSYKRGNSTYSMGAYGSKSTGMRPRGGVAFGYNRKFKAMAKDMILEELGLN